MKGHHDDLIMAMAMSLYVAQNSFTQLKKNVEQAKAMIDSWTVTEETHTPNPKPSIYQTPPNLGGRPGIASPNDAKDYLWLFSGLKGAPKEQ